MSTIWQTVLANRYQTEIDALERTIRECPENLWGASVWDVKFTDRHAWPIIEGVGAELPDDERLQLHSAFWNVAYHTLLALDDYLGGQVAEHNPPTPFHPDDYHSIRHSLPRRVYTREELLGYLEFCRRKAASTFTDLTDEQAEHPTRLWDSFGGLLLHNLLHLNEHVAHLSLFLNLNADWSDSRWTTSNRRFTPCVHCQQ